MMDVTDCPDLTSLQTVLFMILFLQSSSRLSTCYSHIGVVLRSSIRMGLHRSVAFEFNPIEKQIRQRIFWTVRNMDAYIGALLGLPQLLSEEDIDQEMPCEVDDECITLNGILPMPKDGVSLMTAFNAHTRLVKILSKTVRYIYPIKLDESRVDRSYAVSHSKVREIEHDLQDWMESLPVALRPGGEAPPKFARQGFEANCIHGLMLKLYQGSAASTHGLCAYPGVSLQAVLTLHLAKSPYSLHRQTLLRLCSSLH